MIFITSFENYPMVDDLKENLGTVQ